MKIDLNNLKNKLTSLLLILFLNRFLLLVIQEEKLIKIIVKIIVMFKWKNIDKFRRKIKLFRCPKNNLKLKLSGKLGKVHPRKKNRSRVGKGRIYQYLLRWHKFNIGRKLTLVNYSYHREENPQKIVTNISCQVNDWAAQKKEE